MEQYRDPGLRRDAMGTRELLFTVLAAMAPLTLVIAVMPLHFLRGGTAVPLAFLIAGVVMWALATGLLVQCADREHAGGFYRIIARGLGKPAGSGAALLALLSYNALQISVYGALGVYAVDFLESLTGLRAPWWAAALAALFAITWLGYRGINASARVLTVILLGELLVLALLVLRVSWVGGPEGFPTEVFAPSQLQQPGIGAMFVLVFGAFMGFESTIIFSEETRGGYRTVRRATLLAVGFTALFYAMVAIAVVWAYGASAVHSAAREDPVNLVLNLFARHLTPDLFAVTRTLLIGSAFAALLALHNVVNRYLLSLGREKLLPSIFARTHPRLQSPAVAGLAQSALAGMVVLATVVTGTDPYLGLLLWGSALGLTGIVFLWALGAAAMLVSGRRDDSGPAGSLASCAAFLALSAVGVAALASLDFLTGAGPGVNAVLLAAAVIASVAGVTRALWLRAHDPHSYARLAAAPAEPAAG